jgi:predicted GNAT family acetyltransferase
VRGARVTDAAEFRARAGPLLEADELRHTVPLGVLSTLERDPGRYAERYLWLVEDAGDVVACALMTPPFHLLALGRADGFDELVAAVRADGVRVPGVSGFVPEVEEFAQRWTRATGAETRLRMSMRMYSTDAVSAVPVAPGHMRAAFESDRPLVGEWGRAFAVETGLDRSEGPEEVVRSIEGRIGADPGIVVWETGGIPVALAGATESSPGIARVGPVYTPPEHRRRGYATSLVAAWTEDLLGRGVRRCALFTDLANPTSNSIYQAVGYRPVADARLVDFI